MANATKTHRPRKHRRFSTVRLGLLASAAMHVAALLIIAQLKTQAVEPVEPAPPPSSVQIKLTLPIKEKIPPVDSAQPASGVAQQEPRLTKRKSKGSEPVAVDSSTAPKIEHYDQLFPAAGVDYPVANVDADTKSDKKTPPGLSSFDPENDAISFGTATRNLSKLMMFAKELGELIAVPPALRKIESRGAAHARLTRKGSDWEVTEAGGDPYFRALLYETLAALAPKTSGLVMLATSEFDTVRIHFEFRTISVVDFTTKPIELTIDGNKIFLVMTRQELDPKWQMLMAGPAGAPAINLVGVGLALARPYIEPDPHADLDVRRLRLSPAFSRTIGK